MAQVRVVKVVVPAALWSSPFSQPALFVSLNLSCVPDLQVRDQVAELQSVASAGPTSLALPIPTEPGAESPRLLHGKALKSVVPETISDKETQTLASFLAGELLLLRTGAKRLRMRLCWESAGRACAKSCV